MVRRGHIYIAQPPLYQIKRKKREEYVDDDSQLNKILISLGAEEVQLKHLVDGREFTKEQLGEVLDLLERLSKLSDSIRRHGGDFEEYLSNRDPVSGKLPEYLVIVREGNNEYVKYFHDEGPLRDFASQNLDLNLYEEEPVGENGEGALAPVAPPTNGNGSPPVASYMRRRARRVELHESNSVAKVFQELEKRGMTIDHYSASDQPIFELIEGEGDRTHRYSAVLDSEDP